MRGVEFTVYGLPVPQAGTKSVPAGKTRDGKQIFRHISEGGKDLKPWRQSVSEAARKEAEAGVLRGALLLDVTFRFPMPASRPKSLRPWSYKTTKPDTDKLLRAIGDSCKEGGLVSDDAEFAVVRGTKLEVWDSWTGAVVVVRQLVHGHAPGLLMSRTPGSEQGSLL